MSLRSREMRPGVTCYYSDTGTQVYCINASGVMSDESRGTHWSKRDLNPMPSPATVSPVDYATKEWVEQTVRSALAIALNRQILPMIEQAQGAAITDAVACAKRETNRAISGFAARLCHQLPQLIARTLATASPGFVLDTGALTVALQDVFKTEFARKKS